MVTREKVIDSIEGMPKGFELDDLVERLYLLEKIEEGIRSADKGHVQDAHEVLAEIKAW